MLYQEKSGNPGRQFQFIATGNKTYINTSSFTVSQSFYPSQRFENLDSFWRKDATKIILTSKQQCDQIRRIFAQWATVCFGQFLKITEVAQNFRLLSSKV
jgi:hypothetical protein